MGFLRELSAQIVTLENMAFVELQTYSAHPVVVCLLVFTAAVAARLLVSRLPKNREERDGQVKIPQSLLILRRLSHFSWINIFHDCSKTLAKFQNSEQLDIFFLSVHLVVLWIFLGIHFTLSEVLPSYSVFYLIVFTVLCLSLVSFLNYMKIVIIVILKLYIITLAVVTMMC